MFLAPYATTKRYIEDEHVVQTFRRFLPAEGSRKEPLVQFFARNGGMRTIAICDIIDITA